ncbi:XdhC family protein [Streptomyces cavernae]|uniref:XdhC family protein n=1 Tax=Streptomyces cavernae TaxID=2259034 RepID=UPI000FEB8C0B|nr:XdhC family protein [Streptomyces cavernae]
MTELTEGHVPFVRATVVGGRRPAGARPPAPPPPRPPPPRPGDTALVLEDGRIEGFVGGRCAEATVRVQALRTLHSGESLLLRISPAAEGADEPEEGALTVANPCLSGGELEIFLEPLRPAPRVRVRGDTPIARALLAFGPVLGYDVASAGADEEFTDARAVVVASHGRDEEPTLVAAVRAGVPYVGLVASPRRGAAVVAGLDLTEPERARIRTPAGLWIGARTPGEIAVSILAEMIQDVHGSRSRSGTSRPGAATDLIPVTATTTAGATTTAAGTGTGTATDPVCGMTVTVGDGTPYSDRGGERRWFCCLGCRTAYEADRA